MNEFVFLKQIEENYFCGLRGITVYYCVAAAFSRTRAYRKLVITCAFFFLNKVFN